jgi:hypothetical protein
MRMRYLVILLPFLLLALAGTSYAWQGRMGGMGDPYGLVADESDFLIHPAKIANGEGIKFYGDYRFTYTGVTDWNDLYDAYTPTGVFLSSSRSKVSGEELGHNGLLGSSFPLGPGRMGIFFTYEGMRGDYDGDASGPDTSLEIKNDLDSFALRLLYGLPMGSFDLGAETQIAYRQERRGVNDYSAAGAVLNELWIPYPFPPDRSRYGEALFKGSVEGKVGPLDLEFTLKGGFDFAGTSKWSYELQSPLTEWDAKGDVQGWQIGGDLWVRYPLATDLTLPVLVRIDYQTKTRDGKGPGGGSVTGSLFDYQDEERNLVITAGGGVDKEFGKATRIAAGIYYNFLQRKEDFSYLDFSPTTWSINGMTYPDSIEHQLLVRMAGEHTLSRAVALRAGLNFFYGWVTGRIKYFFPLNSNTGFFDIEELSGHSCPHWGIGGSLGGTVKVKPLVLEPFVGGGYQQFRLNAPGVHFDTGGIYALTNEKITRNQWFVTTGLSVLFDL